MKKLLGGIGLILVFLILSPVAFGNERVNYTPKTSLPIFGFDQVLIHDISADRVNEGSITPDTKEVYINFLYSSPSWYLSTATPIFGIDFFKSHIGLMQGIDVALYSGFERVSDEVPIAGLDSNNPNPNRNDFFGTVQEGLKTVKLTRPIKEGEKLSIAFHFRLDIDTALLNVLKFTFKIPNPFLMYQYDLQVAKKGLILKPKINPDVSKGFVTGTGTFPGDKIKLNIEGNEKETIVDNDKKWKMIWDKIILNKSEMLAEESSINGYTGKAVVKANLPAKLSLSNTINRLSFPNQTLSGDYMDVYPNNKNWGISLYDSRNDGKGANWQIMANLVNNQLVSTKNSNHVLKDVLYYRGIDHKMTSITSNSGIIFTNNPELNQINDSTLNKAQNTCDQSIKYKDNVGLYLHIPTSKAYAESYSGVLNITLSSFPLE